MPLSPTRSVNDLGQIQAYQDAGRRLDQLARAGMSWSGYERNCVFLNTGGPRFANISAASGFDFPDDGRSLALVDWDHDGDVDFWAGNRTGPRLRFLRNDASRTHHYLAFRLNGQTANRDGIGARLELTVDADGDQADGSRTLIKTLHAGDGFLGQSSKWVHFGLGDSTQVRELVVRWPGGAVERYSVDAVDAHYLVRQGQSELESWQAPIAGAPLVPTEVGEPPHDDAQVLLPTRIALPRLTYETFAGEERHLDAPLARPMLVNLWASWCKPCMVELHEFSQRAEEIRGLGIDVLALSVDGLGEDGAEPAELSDLVDSLKLPFPTGVARDEVVDKLQIFHDQLFNPRRPLPLPSSVLIDAQGRLAAIYKGPLTVERLAHDVATLAEQGPRLLDQALPFAGRWEAAPRAMRLLPFAAALVDGGFIDDVGRYADANREQLLQDPGFVELLYRLGQEQLERHQMDAALQRFNQAMELQPDQADSYYNLGIAKAAQQDWDEATRLYQRAIELDPAHAKAINNLGNLYMSRQAYEQAEELYLRAAEANPYLADIQFNLGILYQTQAKVDQAKQCFLEATRLDAGHVQAHNNLGVIYAQQGELSEAAEQYRQAVQVNPDYATAHINLANVLAAQGALAEAVSHYRRAIALDPQQADALENLGRVLLAMQQPREAVEALSAAVQLRPERVTSTSYLAWLLATYPDESVRRVDEALKWANHAVSQTDRQDPRALDVLAAAQANAGQFEDATKTAEEALALLQRTGRSDQGESIRRRLEAYQRGEAFRLRSKP